eukprot:TRINITY_DN788_c0_g1_i11.p1 TRINITY_DN788_c0_g1~~TRINITY_DN788_c0_g1_i11.p1  ORF type:complete len:124 (+),score=13.89 TRINITY_DN788_c0_g1_i11:92-463(+)
MNCKYTLAELQKYETSKAKKMVGVTHRDGKYWKDGKQIIPVEELDEWLREYYDNPLTGMKGRDRLYSSIAEKYLGVTRRYVADWLANLETNQIHSEPKNVKISRPVVLRKPMASWAVDLTWLY